MAAAAALAAIALAGVAIASDQAVVVRAGKMVLRLNGGVTPKALPRYTFAPLGFHARGSLATTDGSHPPALGEAEFDVDKDVEVDVEGLPSCRLSDLQARDTKAAKGACADAILGTGSATVEVAFPEQAPFLASGPLILFNGGEQGGEIKLLAYTYVAVPAPTAVVTTATLTREHKGPFGLHSVVKVPRIAGGAGSVVSASLKARRVYTYRGRRHSFLSGRCRDGRIQARGTFRYLDGSVLSGAIVRACTTAD